jgi:uncharacterized protein YggE
MKLVRLAALGAALAALVAFVGVGLPEGASGDDGVAQAERTITVTGTGSVTTVPDRAAMSFGVTTEGRTAAQALSENATQMQKVIDALKQAGVAPADIQTASVSLFPRTSDDGHVIVGYTASNIVTATIRALDTAGAVIDAAVAAGANEVSGPALTRSDQGSLYRQALRAAFADARAKAAAKAAEDSATPVEPGTQTLEAMVTVEFAVS